MTEFKAAPVKPPVALEVLPRIDVRVGRIVKVEDVPKSDKLVRLTVHFGETALAVPERPVPDGARAG